MERISAKLSEGQPPLVRAALHGLCPVCGAKTLFANVVNFSPRCGACGLDFQQFNVGDGPAAFVTLMVGAVLIVLAFLVETMFTPPFWVHLALWIPLTTLAVLWSIRVAKAALLIAEQRRQAAEGVLQSPDTDKDQSL